MFNNILNSENFILVDFSAAWYAPCKAMLPIVEKIKNEYKNNLFVLNVDIETNSELSKKYNVLSVPTFIIFKNGQNVWQQSGAISEIELTKVINNLLNQ